MLADEQYPPQKFSEARPDPVTPRVGAHEGASKAPLGRIETSPGGSEEVNNEHLYSQIHSLTISGYDHHQYESLSCPPQDAVWQAWKRAQVGGDLSPHMEPVHRAS